jgi:hypothetical protein
MGFEPTTFCMASSSHGTGHHKEPPAYARILSPGGVNGWPGIHADYREFGHPMGTR